MVLSLNFWNRLDVQRIDFRRSAPKHLKWNGRSGKLLNHEDMRFVGRDPNTGKYCCDGRNESKFANVDADTEPEVQAIEVERKKLLGQAEIRKLVYVVSMSDHGFYID